jgi:hypothetical protein
MVNVSFYAPPITFDTTRMHADRGRRGRTGDLCMRMNFVQTPNITLIMVSRELGRNHICWTYRKNEETGGWCVSIQSIIAFWCCPLLLHACFHVGQVCLVATHQIAETIATELGGQLFDGLILAAFAVRDEWSAA